MKWLIVLAFVVVIVVSTLYRCGKAADELDEMSRKSGR